MSMCALRTVYYVVHIWTEIETRLEMTSAPDPTFNCLCVMYVCKIQRQLYLSTVRALRRRHSSGDDTLLLHKKKLQAKAS